jgi:hypothetical protein
MRPSPPLATPPLPPATLTPPTTMKARVRRRWQTTSVETTLALAWWVAILACISMCQGASWGHYKTLALDDTASNKDIGKAFR